MTRIAARDLIIFYADRAWSDAELALQVGVDRTTIFKARRALQAAGYIFVTDGRAHYRLDPRRHMTAVRSAALEALAARLAETLRGGVGSGKGFGFGLLLLDPAD